MDLKELADEAFDVIESNTNLCFRHSTVKESFDSFQMIVEDRGSDWLIDAAEGTGMTHDGWAEWMRLARIELGLPQV